MEVGDMKILNKDNTFQKSNKKYLWGKKGEKVKIISINGNAVIYEKTEGLKKGQRFPANIKDFE